MRQGRSWLFSKHAGSLSSSIGRSVLPSVSLRSARQVGRAYKVCTNLHPMMSTGTTFWPRSVQPVPTLAERIELHCYSSWVVGRTIRQYSLIISCFFLVKSDIRAITHVYSDPGY